MIAASGLKLNGSHSQAENLGLSALDRSQSQPLRDVQQIPVSLAAWVPFPRHFVLSSPGFLISFHNFICSRPRLPGCALLSLSRFLFGSP
jgi:hypothetical protein